MLQTFTSQNLNMEPNNNEGIGFLKIAIADFNRSYKSFLAGQVFYHTEQDNPVLKGYALLKPPARSYMRDIKALLILRRINFTLEEFYPINPNKRNETV